MARRFLKEREELVSKLAEAERLSALADAETDRLLAASGEVNGERRAAAEVMRILDEEIEKIKAEREAVRRRLCFWEAESRDCAVRAEEAASESNARRRTVSRLREKATDPRFAEAEACLARVQERKEAEASRASAPLSPENVAGLKLLRRGFDPRGIEGTNDETEARVWAQRLAEEEGAR